MFNAFALRLDDALLKCIVTEVVLFSIVDFKTLTFHEVLLQMLSWFWQWNKFENRLVKWPKKLAQFLYALL